MNRELHIVTLNIPYPPDYGGMIDSFFRIRALAALGIKIHLHCFEYGRQHSVELSEYCTEVNYYPRKTGFPSQLSAYPYIVSSRRAAELLKNLLKDDYPVLFDSLHTTYYSGHQSLAGRKQFVRLHNVEHRYYKHLADAERNPVKKAYFLNEVWKLKAYEKVLKNAEMIFPISGPDNDYYSKLFRNCSLIPPFHQHTGVTAEPGSGTYLLYHGDLSVNENTVAARFLISKVFSRVGYQCIIAGKNPPADLASRISRYKNISLVADPDNARMSGLIRNAHINVLPSVSSDGLKIKLLSALFAGRHCLVNRQILHGTGLDDLCRVAASAGEFIEHIKSLMSEPFTDMMKKERETKLMEHYNNDVNAEKIAGYIFPR